MAKAHSIPAAHATPSLACAGYLFIKNHIFTHQKRHSKALRPVTCEYMHINTHAVGEHVLQWWPCEGTYMYYPGIFYYIGTTALTHLVADHPHWLTHLVAGHPQRYAKTVRATPHLWRHVHQNCQYSLLTQPPLAHKNCDNTKKQYSHKRVQGELETVVSTGCTDSFSARHAFIGEGVQRKFF